MTDDDQPVPRAVSFYVIAGALEDAKPGDEYVVVRSDNDYQYARTLPEANTLAEEMRDEAAFLSPGDQHVAVIELQEVPPEA